MFWLHIQVECTTLYVRCTDFVGQMHNIRRSDAQILQVGCTTFVGRMHRFCRSNAQPLQVGCTTFVGWLHNFCRLDAQLLQVGCTDFVGRMHKVRIRQFLGRALRLEQASGLSPVATFIKMTKLQTMCGVRFGQFLGLALWLGQASWPNSGSSSAARTGQGAKCYGHIYQNDKFIGDMWGYVRLRHLLCVQPT